GTVALVVRDVFQRRAAQPTAGRKKRDRLQAIGLARAVRPDQRHHVAARLETRPAIIAEVSQGEAMNAGGGHVGLARRVLAVIAGLDPAIHRPRQRTTSSYRGHPRSGWIAGSSPAMTNPTHTRIGIRT